MSLTDPDESFYAQTAKEMSEANEWITPQIFGEPQFEKPAMYYWLIRISYKIFGINEFSARFPSAVFGILGIMGIYFLGRVIYSPLCGFISGIIMSTSIFYLVLARACVTDMVLTVFILFALLFFIYAWSENKRHFYLFSSAMCACAVLTKGPIGLFIPGMVMLIYTLTGKRWKKLKDIPVFPSILVFLAISMPWYILAFREHGMAFISEFLGFQNVTRFIVPEHRIGSSPLFYFPVVIGGVFPWSFLMIAGSWKVFTEKHHLSKIGSHKILLASWFLVVFIFFSISRTKLVTYIFPLFPVLAILAGRFLELFINTDDPAVKKITRISVLFTSISCVIGLFAGLHYIRSEYPAIYGPVIYCGSIFVSGILLSFVLVLREKRALSLLAIAVTFMIVMPLLSATMLSEIGRLESSRFLSEKVISLAEPGEAIGGEDDHRRGVAFYTGRKDIANLHPSKNTLLDFLSSKKRAWGIIKKKHMAQLDNTGISVDIIDECGDFVLVTNRLDK